ncbi:MAG: hypothetical protein ACLRQF_17895 [Thomasclavelia ramosa]
MKYHYQPQQVYEVKDGTYTRYTITPEQFGLTRCCKEELVGGTPKDNAKNKGYFKWCQDLNVMLCC